MVEPSCCTRTTTRPRVAAGVGCAGLALALAGCGLVPKSRLDDCHRLSQALQAENSRLKDTNVGLRSQNQDLNLRAEDDARRLRVQEEEIQRLVQSVSAYQEERDQLAAAYARIKGQIRTSVDVHPAPSPSASASGLSRRLQDLARAHDGWEFDPERGVLTIPSAALFEAGSDRLRPEARAWLLEVAAPWNAPEARDLDLLVVGRHETSAVRRAALAPPETQDQDQGQGRERPLGLARAERVRDLLSGAAGIDAARIEVAGFEVPRTGADGPGAASPARDRRIEIHLRRREPAPADPAAAQPAAGAAVATDRSDP